MHACTMHAVRYTTHAGSRQGSFGPCAPSRPLRLLAYSIVSRLVSYSARGSGEPTCAWMSLAVRTGASSASTAASTAPRFRCTATLKESQSKSLPRRAAAACPLCFPTNALRPVAGDAPSLSRPLSNTPAVPPWAPASGRRRRCTYPPPPPHARAHYHRATCRGSAPPLRAAHIVASPQRWSEFEGEGVFHLPCAGVIDYTPARASPPAPLALPLSLA